MRRLVALVAIVSLAACAPTPRVMRYQPDDGQLAAVSWPAAPQTPRLEYAGQLVGEQNFVTLEDEERAGRKFLRWLAGIGRGGERFTELVRPQSGVVDRAGRILVTDAGRPSVFVFDEANGRFDVWPEAADGVDFVSPVGIAELDSGEFVVADAELGEVFVLSADGKPLRRFASGALQRPTGLDVDVATGEIYVADKDARQVKVFSPAGELQRTIGVPGDTGDTLNAPMHLCVAADRVYVSDALNAHVLVFATADGEVLARIGRRGLYVGNLVRPKGVTVDSDGNVYVVESYYDHLLVYDSTGQFLLPLGGTGAGIGQFFLPAGTWSDPGDRIFVADMFNGRVMIFRYVGADS